MEEHEDNCIGDDDGHHAWIFDKNWYENIRTTKDGALLIPSRCDNEGCEAQSFERWVNNTYIKRN